MVKFRVAFVVAVIASLIAAVVYADTFDVVLTDSTGIDTYILQSSAT